MTEAKILLQDGVTEKGPLERVFLERMGLPDSSCVLDLDKLEGALRAELSVPKSTTVVLEAVEVSGTELSVRGYVPDAAAVKVAHRPDSIVKGRLLRCVLLIWCLVSYRDP